MYFLMALFLCHPQQVFLRLYISAQLYNRLEIWNLGVLMYCCSVAKSHPTLWPHELQHARLSCPSLSPRICSNSFPLSQWCYPIISSSVASFSCPQSFPASRSFLVSWLFASGGQSIGASASVLPMNIQGWFPRISVGLTGLISLQSEGLSKSLLQHHSWKASILWRSAFFMVQLTSICECWKNHSFDKMDLCWQSDVSAF